MMVVLSTVVVALLLVTYVEGQIASGCERQACFGVNPNRVCFEFGQIREGKLNWYQADELCRRKGMHLATFDTQAEIDFVYKYFKDCVKYDYHYWIGATDTATEGTFIWDYTGQPVTVTNWASSQPNDAFGASSGGADCVEIWSQISNGVGSWWNYNCEIHKASYICRGTESCATSTPASG